ncbi:hypothetical protein BDW67DRAFT_188972 [Aspergillus spinulosporus]
MAPSWGNVAVGALALSCPGGEVFVSAQAGSRQPAAPGYHGMNTICPSPCFKTGSHPLCWSVYSSVDRTSACKQAVLYSFSLYDDVDDKDSNHRIYACTTYGHNWDDETKAEAAAARPAENVSVTYGFGWTTSETGTEADYSWLMEQMREYVIGQGLRAPDVANTALKTLDSNTADFDGKRDALAIQLCGHGYDPDHVLGFIALNHGTMGDIQRVFRSWCDAKCLDFANSTSFTTTAPFILPQLSSIKGNHTVSRSNAALTAGHQTRQSLAHLALHARTSECRTEMVGNGDSYAALAERYGISGAEFTKHSPDKGLCSSLAPGQHACSLSGDFPDFRPKPNHDAFLRYRHRAPGTAKPNTNGCISNCGTDIVKGSAPYKFRSIAYNEGYPFKRECLYQYALQINT